MSVLDVTFEPSMKPEGVTAFPGADVRDILIVEDSGGFATFSTA